MDNVPNLTANITHNDHAHAYFQVKAASAFQRFLCISTAKYGVLQFTRMPGPECDCCVVVVGG